MLKLPVCPYCHTIYRYSEVKKSTSKKSKICYHCNKEFIISKKGTIILFLIIVLIASVINVAQLYITPTLNILLIMVTNIILIIIGILLIPFFISYKHIKKGINLRKNKRK